MFGSARLELNYYCWRCAHGREGHFVLHDETHDRGANPNFSRLVVGPPSRQLPPTAPLSRVCTFFCRVYTRFPLQFPPFTHFLTLSSYFYNLCAKNKFVFFLLGALLGALLFAIGGAVAPPSAPLEPPLSVMVTLGYASSCIIVQCNGPTFKEFTLI